MSARRSGSEAAPQSAESSTRQYDSEIKDMASYVHKYKVDSELAVSRLWIMGCST